MANLSALLDKEVSAEIEAILSEAKESAAELLSQAQAEADAISAQLVRGSEVQRDAALVRAQSSAKLEAASLKLKAQHAAVENVFAGVGRRFDSLRQDADAYRLILSKLISEAASAFPDSGVKAIHVNPADVELAEGIIASLGLVASIRSDNDVGAGVRLRGQDNVVVENTLGQRLDALRDELASDVSGLLFSAET